MRSLRRITGPFSRAMIPLRNTWTVVVCRFWITNPHQECRSWHPQLGISLHSVGSLELDAWKRLLRKTIPAFSVRCLQFDGSLQMLSFLFAVCVVRSSCGILSFGNISVQFPSICYTLHLSTFVTVLRSVYDSNAPCLAILRCHSQGTHTFLLGRIRFCHCSISVSMRRCLLWLVMRPMQMVFRERLLGIAQVHKSSAQFRKIDNLPLKVR